MKLKMLSKYNFNPYLRLAVDSKIVRFSCPGLDKSEIEPAALFDDFLLDLSKGKNTFVHTYRLSDISELVDESKVMLRADVLLEPYNSFFQLSELKTKSAGFGDDIICEAEFMFFDKKVKWDDFLASYQNIKSTKLIKSGLLSACFYVMDHGADFCFEADVSMLGVVQTLVTQLSELGWQIDHCKKNNRRKAMADKKGKKQQEKIMTHPKLGDMKYDYYDDAWHPILSGVMKVPLWGKFFEVVPEFMAKNSEQGINSFQEESYERFNSLMVEQNAVMEQMILKYSGVSEEETATMFVPTNVYFGRRGECLLAFQDTEIEEIDDDFPGFTMFISPKKLLLEESDNAVFRLRECLEEEEASRYIRGHGYDPVFIGLQPWNASALEINTEEPDEAEREERKKRFQLKYGQELLKYEQEKAEKAKQWQEKYDSIEMPRLLDIGLVRFAVVVVLMWVLLVVGKIYFKWLLILAIPIVFSTICFLALCCYHCSRYFLAKRDFDSYKRKVMEEEGTE